MDAFRYQALDAAGASVRGVVEADTPREARTQLRARGLLPSTLDKVQARQAWPRGPTRRPLVARNPPERCGPRKDGLT